MNPDSEVEALEIRLLLEAIHSKYGYDFRGYSTGSMRRRVLAAAASLGANHLGELQHWVLTDPLTFARVLEELTVQVTQMYRDPEFYRTFRERVVPILRTYPTLKIWHAGCATGEEVYGVAIVLIEEGLYDRTQIYATDMSPRAIEHARLGTYSAAEAESFAECYARAGGRSTFSNYYLAAYGGIAIKELVRRNILFFQHNLVSDDGLGEMHAIFCRNVLIYFGQQLRHRILQTFADSLCPGGFLCLGSSESLLRGRRWGGADTLFSEFAAKDRIYRFEGSVISSEADHD